MGSSLLFPPSEDTDHSSRCSGYQRMVQYFMPVVKGMLSGEGSCGLQHSTIWNYTTDFQSHYHLDCSCTQAAGASQPKNNWAAHTPNQGSCLSLFGPVLQFAIRVHQSAAPFRTGCCFFAVMLSVAGTKPGLITERKVWAHSVFPIGHQLQVSPGPDADDNP